MTTRPNLGRPPPQRSLSSTNPIQRPPSQRSRSQQFTPSSAHSARRGNENHVDLTVERDTALGPRPRIGASRLRVEISTASKHGKSMGSPAAAPGSTTTSPWKPSQPPRGRPRLHFDVPSVSKPRSRPAQEARQHDNTIKSMPLPVRPGLYAPPVPAKVRPPPANPTRKDARPKPYTLDTPAAAPRYPSNAYADFVPWTGNHPEDRFSENIIRQGCFDKTQMTRNETATARQSVYPALKHKSGLQNLASLFTGVLTHRRNRGQITSASTFKPPPRVTVTDTKREMWLKDLANPTISLRRLSRSIPHGIRGKVLLDQSLSKNIPIERAVWLAKCVGANELRSFRRKGGTGSGSFPMGGEVKWIRDFTVSVEQFVESIVGACGEADFKCRINYAIRLATHFHAEHLLDREHYMDWLVSTLENSPQAKLPIWLLITQVYWKDLLMFRRYGRRLAAALLSHLAETLTNPDYDILAPLTDRLRVLVKGLMTTSADNFVSPMVWARHRDVIMSDLSSHDQLFTHCLERIDRRNTRLAAQGKEKELTSKRRLIQMLDGVRSSPFTNELARKFWQLDDDKEMLMRTVLEWCTSSHRPGNVKVYIGARTFRAWTKLGADITSVVLGFFDSSNTNSSQSPSSFYHLVSELARSDHFSTPRYMQWLIARGGIRDPKDLSLAGLLPTRILAEIPTHNVSDSILDLRMTLLARAQFSVEEEETRLADIMCCMSRNLSGMQTNLADLDLECKECPGVNHVNVLILGASRTIKSELGLWLRQKVQLQTLQPTIPPLNDWDDSPVKGGASLISPADFSTVRQYLELIEDYSMLADVLKMATSSNDAEVLASCADTLNLHLEEFAAIGALTGLFDILMVRLRILTDESDSVLRGFLVSLSDLASRLPEQCVVAQQLAKQLNLSDRKTAADACSPVSDHMAVVETAEADFTDEIEKVLASGNSMDQATLERLFQRITLRLESAWEKSPEQQRSCGLLLTRLKTFDAQHFDTLMITWVKRLLHLHSRPSMMQVFGPLISFGCLAICAVIAYYRAISEKVATVKSFVKPVEVLALLMGPCKIPEVITPEEAYRLQIKQAHMQKDQPTEVLYVIRQALEEPADIDSDWMQDGWDSETLIASPSMRELLQSLVLSDADEFVQKLAVPLLRSPNSEVVRSINETVDDLLVSGSSHATITTEVLLSVANDLSLPFCQVKLATMFQMEDVAMEGAENSRSGRLEAFDVAIEAAVTAGNTTWASIVPLLDASIAQHLRQRADAQFLALFPAPKTITGYDSASMALKLMQAENLLRIIDATSYSIPTTAPSSNLASEIVTTLSGTWNLMSGSQSQDIKDLVIRKWLPLLLYFISTHTFAFGISPPGPQGRAKTILGLTAVLLQLQAVNISSEFTRGLVEQTFDLALHLVDLLPEEWRQKCILSLRDNSLNSQVCYLFSYATNPTSWLYLSQKERIPASGNEARPVDKEKLTAYPLRRWEMLGEPTPNVGENDTSLSLTLFGARRG